MKTINVWNTKTGWVVDFTNDESVRKLFGTTTLPTAYCSDASLDMVLAAVKAANPQHNVIAC